MRVIKVLVHGEMTCATCGGIAVRLTVAPVSADGRIGEPESYPTAKCDACSEAQCAADEKRCEILSEQRAWARKSKKAGATRA